MTLTILLTGLGFFILFFILFFTLLKPASAGSALLAQVTQQAREGVEEGGSPSRRLAVSLDQLAKPFAIFRRFFSGEPNPTLVRRLMLAGYRNPAYSDIFLGARLALPALLGFSVVLLVHENTLTFFLLTVIVGFFLPEFWLNEAIKRRRERIGRSLPDGLDLLSICLEAGLGLDQGIVRVGEELRLSHPELSEEFLAVNYEQRVGGQRVAAWKSFADRVDVESVRSFVAMLIQTERFGTPISRSLAAFSDGLRIHRRQVAEELAAKTAVKLVLPLALFIFPETFLVTVGPAILAVIKNLGNLFG